MGGGRYFVCHCRGALWGSTGVNASTSDCVASDRSGHVDGIEFRAMTMYRRRGSKACYIVCG